MGEREISGKSFLITGGASGLGALYAEAFVKEGAKNVAIADISEQTGKETAGRLNNTYPGKVTFFKCDVSNEEEIASTFDKVVAKLGRVDVLINNAGIMSDNPAVWRTACDVNWQGLVSFTMRAQKHMRKDEGGAGGTIISISSTAGICTFKAIPAYAGSKAAVLHFCLSLSEPPYYDLTGVRILTICPGRTDTALMQGLKDRAYTEKEGQKLDDEFAVINKVRPPQKPESVVAACVKTFKEGAPGSVWLTVNNNPCKDITPVIRRHLDELTMLVFE